MQKVYDSDTGEFGPALSPEDMARIIVKDKQSWLRFTIWERGHKSDGLFHFKLCLQQKAWNLISIYSREFDLLTLDRLREICSHIHAENYSRLPKLETLDILDYKLVEARNYLAIERVSKHLGRFRHSWNGQVLTLKLYSDSSPIIIDTMKKGVIEFLLEELERKELKKETEEEDENESEEEEETDKEEIELDEEDDSEESESEEEEEKSEEGETTAEENKFWKEPEWVQYAGDFYFEVVDSTVIVGLEEEDRPRYTFTLSEEGFIVKLLKAFGQTPLMKKLRLANSTLEKVSNSFAESEKANDILRKNNEELEVKLELAKTDLIVAQSQIEMLKNELTISRITPDASKPITNTNPDHQFFGIL